MKSAAKPSLVAVPRALQLTAPDIFVDPGSLEEMGCLPRMAASLTNFLVVKHKKPLRGWLFLEVFKFHEPIHETFSEMLSQLYRYSKCCQCDP